MYLFGECISINVPYMKSLASTMWPGMLYTDDDIDADTSI